MTYARSVFVNCPFDEDYWDLFRPLIFTILKLGLKPRYSLERADCSETRISKITELIGSCQFGIHDLSRCQAQSEGEFYRLNMPLELGLDVGAKLYGSRKLKNKKILILEEEQFRFQAAISDISNSDIKSHSAEPIKIVRVVRDWLVQEAGVDPLSPSVIWYSFNDCLAEVYDNLRAEGFTEEDVQHLPGHELIQRMTNWVELQR